MSEEATFLNRYGRFEIKYLVTTEQGKRIRERLYHFMRIDPFANELGYYVNRSLYYDTPDLKEYAEYIDGEKRRRKVRLRRYLLDNDKVNVELKQKLNKIIWKDKVSLDIKTASELLATPTLWVDNENETVGSIARQIARYSYEPKVTIVYQRIPFLDLINGKVRITFDYNIRCGEEEMFYREVSPDDMRVLPPGYEVLELKFTRTCPNWCRKIIDDFSLSPTTYSKYANSMDRMYFKTLLRSAN